MTKEAPVISVDGKSKILMDNREKQEFESALPVKKGLAKALFLLVFSDLWFVLAVFLFNHPFTPPAGLPFAPFVVLLALSLICYYIANSVIGEPIIPWLKRFFQNNVIGHTLAIKAETDFGVDRSRNEGRIAWISYILGGRGYQDRYLIDKSPSAGALLIYFFVPIGGWFRDYGRERFAQNDKWLWPTLHLFRISYVNVGTGFNPVVKVEDQAGNSLNIYASQVIRLLSWIFPVLTTDRSFEGLLFPNYKDVIVEALFHFQYQASELASLRQELGGERENAAALREELNGYRERLYQQGQDLEGMKGFRQYLLDVIIEAIGKLDDTKRYIKSKQAQEIREWLARIAVTILDKEDPRRAKLAPKEEGKANGTGTAE